MFFALVEIGHVVLEKKKIKNDGQQTNFDQKSSGELKEKGFKFITDKIQNGTTQIKCCYQISLINCCSGYRICIEINKSLGHVFQLPV